ncbi:hypothetical protein BH10BDE1_BH10BDE1_14040 [soil metagenome]
MTFTHVALTEIRQNLKLTATLVIVSLLLGISIAMVRQVERKVASLALPIRWGAELAIIPKGLTLNQLAENLKVGQAPALLPLAMFETTVDLTRGNVQMSAVLPGHDSGGAFLMTRGDSKLNLDWAPLPQRPWAVQSEFSTPDWSTNVIAAAFASGTRDNLLKLKDLIDRKTVAQAFMIEDSQAQAREKQNQISHLAAVTEGLVIFTLLLGFYLAGSWLLENHGATQITLFNMGFTSINLLSVKIVLLALLVVVPLIIGLAATPNLI